MKKETLLIIAAAGIAAYLFFNRKNTKYYTLPNGQRVTEAQLPSYGYIRTQFGWMPQSTYNQTQAQAQSTGQNWVNIITNLGQAATGIIEAVNAQKASKATQNVNTNTWLSVMP